MDCKGFLNINKPEGWTSHDVVAKLRGIIGIKKIGHAGTLDPFATGVLPIAVGSSTRLIRFLESNKRYIAEINLNHLTDTDDLTGEKLDGETLKQYEEALGPSVTQNHCRDWDQESFSKALESFQGDIEQTPPLYSAIHHQGKKLYELMRSGKKIELKEVKKRCVTIPEIKLIKFDYPMAIFELSCSEGTYIRSIARDLGGHLTRLTRIESNNFDIDHSHEIKDLEKCDDINEYLVAPGKMLKLKSMTFNDKETLDLQQGKKIGLNKQITEVQNGENYIQCIDESDDLIGIALVDTEGEKHYLKPKVIL